MCPRGSLDGRDPDASMGKRDPPPIHKENCLLAMNSFCAHLEDTLKRHHCDSHYPWRLYVQGQAYRGVFEQAVQDRPQEKFG